MSEPNLEKLLSGILSRLSVIESRLASLEDHENRLRELEQDRYKNAWVISLVSTLVTVALVAIITKGIN